MQELKNVLIKAYRDSAEQLKKGNVRGYGIIDDALDSVATLVDDEEVLFQNMIIGSIARIYLKEQSELEGGDRFLRELGVLFEKVGKAYESNDMGKLNEIYRKIPLLLNKRWKESRHLMEMLKE